MRPNVKLGFEQRRPEGQAPPRWPRFRLPTMTPEEAAERQALLDHGYRYRVMVFDRPATPWRARLALTKVDAIRGGFGSRCEQTGHLFMTVPAWIQEERVEP